MPFLSLLNAGICWTIIKEKWKGNGRSNVHKKEKTCSILFPSLKRSDRTTFSFFENRSAIISFFIFSFLWMAHKLKKKKNKKRRVQEKMKHTNAFSFLFLLIIVGHKNGRWIQGSVWSIDLIFPSAGTLFLFLLNVPAERRKDVDDRYDPWNFSFKINNFLWHLIFLFNFFKKLEK